MWVDMFPMDMPAPPPAVEISPRKPKRYLGSYNTIYYNSTSFLRTNSNELLFGHSYCLRTIFIRLNCNVKFIVAFIIKIRH